MSSPASTKGRILEALRSLASDATVDDALERLVFMAEAEEGLRQFDAGEPFPTSRSRSGSGRPRMERDA